MTIGELIIQLAKLADNNGGLNEEIRVALAGDGRLVGIDGAYHGVGGVFLLLDEQKE
jgi:hypothetical protein